jgi:hypothetical protein
MKSPHDQRPDDEARVMTEEFIRSYARGRTPVAGAAKVESPAQSEAETSEA